MSTDVQDYSREIDCRLPYDDEDHTRSLIDRGIGLSPDMAFRVLYEICLPGRRRKGRPTSGQLKRLLKYWRSHFNHPVADLLTDTAITLIDRKQLSDQDAISRMQIVAGYPKLYSALMILSCSCEDADGSVDALHDEIVQKWIAAEGAV